jgi:hypothetical protein
MTSAYRRDRVRTVYNDEFADMLNEDGRAVIINSAAFFEGQADTDDTPTPSEGERLALKRAMARFLIDSGIASARGWLNV